MYQKSRALELMERFEQGGIDTINELIADGVEEDYFIEYKASANNGHSNRLHDTDKSVLSKAISGFANTEGGILIWGVDCRKNDRGIDIPSFKKPISSPERFKTNIDSIASGRVVPPVHGLRSLAIIEDESGEETGYVVTYIPRTYSSPVRSIVHERYYLRVNGAFVPAPHSALSVMFGRRPQPHLFPMYSMYDPEFNHITGKVFAKAGILLTNGGAVHLRNAFINLQINFPRGSDAPVIGVLPKDQAWTHQEMFGCVFSYVARSDYLIPPNFSSEPFIIYLELQESYEGGLDFEFTFGCDDAAVSFGRMKLSEKEFAATYQQFVRPHILGLKQGTLTDQDKSSLKAGIQKIFPLPTSFGGYEDYWGYLESRKRQ